MFRLSGLYWILGLLVLALLAWSGWWWIAASAQKEAVLGWMEKRREAGWAAEVGAASVSGYPNRVDLTLTDLLVADPEAGWAWRAPQVELMQLSYRPDQAVLAFPGAQSFAAPGGAVEVGADSLRASAAVSPDLGLRLLRLVIEGEGVKLTGRPAGAAPVAAQLGAAAGGEAAALAAAAGQGWTIAAEKMVIALREAEDRVPSDGPYAYDAAATLSTIVPPPALTELFGLGRALPGTAEAAKIDAVLGFEQPLGRASAEAGGARLATVRLKPSVLSWGPLSLRALGAVKVDAEGYPEGEITVRAENWRAALNAAVATGAIPRKSQDAVRGALEVISFLAGKGNGLEAPLRFANGTMYLGPAPIGAAPRLTLPR